MSCSPVYPLLAFHPENREVVQRRWRALTHRPTLSTIEMCSQQQASAKPQIPPKMSAPPMPGSCTCVWPPYAWDVSKTSPWSLLLGEACLAFLPLPCKWTKLCYSCALEGGECFLCSLWAWERARGWNCCLGELPGALPRPWVAAANTGGGRKQGAGELQDFVPQTRARRCEDALLSPLSNHSLITPWVLAGRRTLLGVLPSYSSGLCLHPPWACCLRQETPCCVNYPWFGLSSIVCMGYLA